MAKTAKTTRGKGKAKTGPKRKAATAPAAKDAPKKAAQRESSGPGKRGRPSRYAQEIGEIICDRLMDGETLRQICCDESMPDERTVRRWAANPEHPFSPHYIRAREIGYLRMVDELLEIADDGSNDWMKREGKDTEPGYVANGEHVQRSRLRVDTRKWVLAKMLPKVFGEKFDSANAKAGAKDQATDNPRPPDNDHLSDLGSRFLSQSAPTPTAPGTDARH